MLAAFGDIISPVIMGILVGYTIYLLDEIDVFNVNILMEHEYIFTELELMISNCYIEINELCDYIAFG